MVFLVGNQLGGLGERDDGYGDTAPVELMFE